MTDNRTPAELEAGEHRRAQVLAMRRRAMTFEQIGRALNPPVSRQRAHAIYWDALGDIVMPEAVALRTEAAERLDDLRRELYAVLEATHPLVQGGKVVRFGEARLDEEGQPYIEVTAGEELVDVGPKLAAIRELRKVEERAARLFGLDAPVKTEHGGGVVVRHEVVGLPDTDVLT